jgi:hypothetical protein
MNEEVGPARAPAGSLKDSRDDAAGSEWQLVHAIIRSLLLCGEAYGLYSQGHQRIRLALKSALEWIQDYYAKGSKTFGFVPEMAMDMRASESSQAAMDMSTFGTQCRARLIPSMAIHPEVNCEETRRLHSVPAGGTGRRRRVQTVRASASRQRPGGSEVGSHCC